MQMTFPRLLLAAVGAAAIAICGSTEALAQKKRLTVYTALEDDQLAAYKKAVESDYPDLDIAWVQDSTGVITARLLAEKDNPQADAVWGLAVSSLLVLEQQGMLQAYTPKGAEALKPQFRDSKNPMTWTGMDAFVSAICFNTVEAAKLNIPQPTKWTDLLDPKYRGQIVMPNPASSGGGFLTVAAWIEIMGEQKAWEFMDKLHDNIAVYMHSGSAPCVQAARGERVVGISFDLRASVEKSKGAPIEVVLPTEGLGWDMEATGIIRGTKNLDGAMKLADWAVSPKANELYGKYYAIVARPGMNTSPPNYPAQIEGMMIKNDFSWMAANRERILAEWSKRYDSKSAPK
jgi:iron(III) transport system substrate-binding protein